MRLDGQAWNRGFEDGEPGEPLRSCPYASGSTQSWSWVSGYIEGKAARNGCSAASPALDKIARSAAAPYAVPLRSTAPGPAADVPIVGGVKIGRR